MRRDRDAEGVQGNVERVSSPQPTIRDMEERRKIPSGFNQSINQTLL